jgi:hypothetical protein
LLGGHAGSLLYAVKRGRTSRWSCHGFVNFPPDFDNQGTWRYGEVHPWLRAERVINKSLTST